MAVKLGIKVWTKEGGRFIKWGAPMYWNAKGSRHSDLLPALKGTNLKFHKNRELWPTFTNQNKNSFIYLISPS